MYSNEKLNEWIRFCYLTIAFALRRQMHFLRGEKLADSAALTSQPPPSASPAAAEASSFSTLSPPPSAPPSSSATPSPPPSSPALPGSSPLCPTPDPWPWPAPPAPQHGYNCRPNALQASDFPLLWQSGRPWKEKVFWSSNAELCEENGVKHFKTFSTPQVSKGLCYETRGNETNLCWRTKIFKSNHN